MSLEIVFLSGASGDLQETFNYLEDRREDSGQDFLQEVDASLSRLAMFP